jgi:hypothetical protein
MKRGYTSNRVKTARGFQRSHLPQFMSRFSPVLRTSPSNARTLATLGTSDSAPKERQDLAQRSRPMRSHVSEPLRSAKCLTAGWRSVAHDRLLLDIAIGMFFFACQLRPGVKGPRGP